MPQMKTDGCFPSLLPPTATKRPQKTTPTETVQPRTTTTTAPERPQTTTPRQVPETTQVLRPWKPYRPTLKTEREVALEVASLLNEGYIFKGDAFLMGNVYSVTLKHSTNKNKMIVTRRGKTIEIKKNGEIVKSYKLI